MFDILLIASAIFIIVYLYLTWHHDYWAKQNVPYVKPSVIFGTSKKLVFASENISFFYKRYYDMFPDEPAVGLFKVRRPQLLLRDIDLIKTVCVKEFSSFVDNDMVIDEKVDPILALNPFVTKGEKWKTIRSMHTSKLSSGKIKAMYPSIENVGKDMLAFLEKNQKKEFESRYFAGQFTTDVVGSCVYGLKTNSFLDPKAKFREMSSKIFTEGTLTNLAFSWVTIAPKLASWLKIKIINPDVIDFIKDIVQDVYEYRTKNNISVNDYLGYFLEENKKSESFSFEEIAGHTMTFFLDGYETSSLVMGFTIHLLAIHPDVQQKLREEVNSAENLDYNTVSTLPYLDAVIYESLRMFPPLGKFNRQCTKEITLESKGRKYHLKPGMNVVIPAYAIFHDENIFPEPNVFKPERLYKKTLPAHLFPFGVGPRMCLGQKFALTQIKFALSVMVRDFRILPADEKSRKMAEINRNVFFMNVSKEPMNVKFEKILN